MGDYQIRSDCRLCHHTELETLLRLPDTPLANELPRHAEGELTASGVSSTGHHWHTVQQAEKFPLYLVGCKRCGHVQLPVVVDPKRLFGPDYPYASGTSPVFRAHLAELAGTLRRMGTFRVLDVACNDGTLVRQLQLHGATAMGVDPCAPELDDWLMRGFFSEQWAKNHSAFGFDCITALNVFAHVDDLDDFTRGVKVLLEPGGLFVIEAAYLPDMVRAGIWDTIYAEHLAFHHLSPLVRFFARHGMTMVDAHRIDSQGGSVRIFVRNHDGSHQGGDDGRSHQSERLQALLDDESRSALWDGLRAMVPGTAQWGVRGVRDRIKSAAMRAGGKAAVYGAPAKLCTLLHATDTADLVSEVYDDNPLKQGRYVPGTRIPIRPVSEMYEKRPKVVLLASWNFADDVKRRHAELGCEWVVPFGGA